VLTRFARWILIGCFGVGGAVAHGDVVAAAVSRAPASNRARAANPAKVAGKKPVKKRQATLGKVKRRVVVQAVPAVKGGLPNVQAQGAVVLDAETGRELYSRNPDRERPIASISKLAAALVVMDKGLELEGLSTITRADIDVARGGAKSRLTDGMTLSNRDLLHAALMGSDNRAVPALGRAIKLGPGQLAAAMNVKARELGLKNTQFREPTGLSTDNVSTPRETIIMLRAVMNHPALGPITRRMEYDAHPVGRPAIRYFNTYRPAVRSNVQILGGKTGYNDDARYCLVIGAKIDGHTYFMSFLANEGKLTRFGDVARVADWIISRKPKGVSPPLPGTATAMAAGPGAAAADVSATDAAVTVPSPLPVGVAAPPAALDAAVP
jgi:D-alanyl-D-alanine endopeptidase (penicillin-binding protein 7)